MTGPLGGLAGGSRAQLLVYNLIQSIVSAALSPLLASLQQEALSVDPVIPLSPADLALAVIRNVRDEASAAHEALLSGVDGARFADLVAITGEAPAPAELAEALRRGLIDSGTYDRGIRQGRLRDEWGALVRELSVRQPSPEQILNAYLEGQIDEGTARQDFAKLGGDPNYFTILFNSQGQAPTPVQALDLANRGVIPWAGTGPGATSYEQAFLEGPWRNKWLPAFQALAVYLPPPRTITAMLREGAYTKDQAAALLAKHGLSATDIAAYLTAATHGKLAKHKELSETTVVKLYEDQLIDPATAVADLERLGFDAGEAGQILALADASIAHRFTAAAISRVHALYVRRKIDRANAQTLLESLKVPTAGLAATLDLWDLERAANVRTLTEAQIVGAWKVKILDDASAQQELITIGYGAFDAWVLLSEANKAPLGNRPPGGIV